jgi:integrase
MRLTKANVSKFVLPEGRSEVIIFDDGLPGFGLRVRAGGKRSWIAQYRVGVKQRRMTLGTVGTVDPDEARRRAKAALSKVHLGEDPQHHKAAARALASVTVGRVIESYLARRAAPCLKPSSFEDVRRYLRNHWSPLHETAVNAVPGALIAARLAELARDRGPYSSNRARAALSAFFSWAIGEGLADANPVAGSNRATDEISRDRVLSPDELRLAWQHAGPGDYGAILRLLILTGQRREEVGGALWSEIDLNAAIWSIGAGRTKNGLPHDVPLSAAAAAILRGLPRREDRDQVFGSGDGSFQGWSKAKAALDARMATANGAKLKPWRLHDIRRTVATRLGDLGVMPHLIEAVLNHISGHRAGVAGVYNRAIYAAEKRESLEKWARAIAGGSDA